MLFSILDILADGALVTHGNTVNGRGFTFVQGNRVSRALLDALDGEHVLRVGAFDIRGVLIPSGHSLGQGQGPELGTVHVDGLRVGSNVVVRSHRLVVTLRGHLAAVSTFIRAFRPELLEHDQLVAIGRNVRSLDGDVHGRFVNLDILTVLGDFVSVRVHSHARGDLYGLRVRSQGSLITVTVSNLAVDLTAQSVGLAFLDVHHADYVVNRVGFGSLLAFLVDALPNRQVCTAVNTGRGAHARMLDLHSLVLILRILVIRHGLALQLQRFESNQLIVSFQDAQRYRELDSGSCPILDGSAHAGGAVRCFRGGELACANHTGVTDRTVSRDTHELTAEGVLGFGQQVEELNVVNQLDVVAFPNNLLAFVFQLGANLWHVHNRHGLASIVSLSVSSIPLDGGNVSLDGGVITSREGFASQVFVRHQLQLAASSLGRCHRSLQLVSRHVELDVLGHVHTVSGEPL